MKLFKRSLMMVTGILFIGICVGAYRLSAFGVDAFTCMNLGISGFLGMSFGAWQLLMNAAILAVVFLKARKCIGAGTIVNMVGVGYIADFCMRAINARIPPDSLSMGQRVLMFAVSMAVFLVAASFYMVVDLGVAPYDAIPQLIAAHTKKLSYRAVRMIWDISMLSMGFLLGSTIGLTTLITGFFLGPAITLVAKRVHGWFE